MADRPNQHDVTLTRKAIKARRHRANKKARRENPELEAQVERQKRAEPSQTSVAIRLRRHRMMKAARKKNGAIPSPMLDGDLLEGPSTSRQTDADFNGCYGEKVLAQTFFNVNKDNKMTKLMDILNEGADGTVIFVETDRDADFLASFLSEMEFSASSIHGDRLQSQLETLSDFKTGKKKVLISTSVASRSLDIKYVKHVINYDMPNSFYDYVHRIGSVGDNGRATSFFDHEEDHAITGDLIKTLESSGQEVPNFLKEVSAGSNTSCTITLPQQQQQGEPEQELGAEQHK